MSVERHLNAEVTPWTGEHLHRYYEAKKYINPGDVVLDLACGTGYGTEILGSVENTEVYGGDIEPETIDFCKQTSGTKPSLHFEVMDATQLRFEDGFFNKIVSLETIEHLTAYRKMLSEFSRVLKPGGVAVISTPNIKISSPGGKIVNPFHTQEFTYDEFEGLLKAEFSKVSVFGQQYSRYLNGRASGLMHAFEKLMLQRGIRKLPYALRNGIFSMLFKHPLYPIFTDYQLFANGEYIEKNCHVLYAVCVK